MSPLAVKLVPSETALIVIDMQNDFCADEGYLHKRFGRDMSSNIALADRIMATVERARAAGVMVVWIKANYEPRFLGAAMKAKADPDLICCEGGTWGWDFYRVEPLAGEPVVEKHCYSGFYETNLDETLKAKDIKNLVLCGVATNVCVESTLREAYFNGYFVTMPEDLVAAGTPEFQQASIDNVRSYFGDVPMTQEVTDIWASYSVNL
jgi:ureidoacrylate peracid hydrolase